MRNVQLTRERFRVFCGAWCLLAIFGAAAPSASAQAQAGAVPPTRLQRLLDHFDLGIQATGEFSSSVSGTPQNTTAVNNQPFTQSGSSTVGAMATIRARKSPYVGGEFNFRYDRATQSFKFPPVDPNAQPTNAVTSFTSQNTANEYTVGYLATPPHPLFGTQPYVGGGGGSIEFTPTRQGGDNLPVQARAAYYYTAGVQKLVYQDLVGVRLGFRQVFYLAPDFEQNYLTIKKMTSSYEPTIGFYIHF